MASSVISVSAAAPQAGSPERLAFEVASVKPNPKDVAEGISLSPNGDVRFTGFHLRTLITIAYGSPTTTFASLLGGPPWIATDRFDIVARAGGDISVDAQGRRSERLTAMLRTLLADRFQLRVHTEMWDTPIFALRLSNRDGTPGPGLRPSSIECPRFVTGAPPPAIDPDRWCGIRAVGGTIVGHAVSAAQIAGNLAGYPSVGRPVLDRTGLTERYDFQIDYSPEFSDASDPVSNGGPGLFTALREQLGFTLQSEKASLPVIVIDRAERPAPD